MTQDLITLTRPDDMHLHVRDGAALHTVVPHTAAEFARAVIMPNLKPPITTTADALAYRCGAARVSRVVTDELSVPPRRDDYVSEPASPSALPRGVGHASSLHFRRAPRSSRS